MKKIFARACADVCVFIVRDNIRRFRSPSFSNHTMLKSAGMCLGLGIGYSFLGAVCIVPPLLRRVFKQPVFSQKSIVPGSKEHFKAIMTRYTHVKAYPRFFTRFRDLNSYPMFPGLAFIVKSPKNILDMARILGLPSGLASRGFSGRTHILPLDPDEKRVFIALRAIGPRGTAVTGSAPDLPKLSCKLTRLLCRHGSLSFGRRSASLVKVYKHRHD